jgi:hypothetical protein
MLKYNIFSHDIPRLEQREMFSFMSYTKDPHSGYWSWLFNDAISAETVKRRRGTQKRKENDYYVSTETWNKPTLQASHKSSENMKLLHEYDLIRNRSQYIPFWNGFATTRLKHRDQTSRQNEDGW